MSAAGGIVVVLSAGSGEQVYGTPTTPVNPNPNGGGGGGTLPVTGFEVVLLVAAVVLALAVGWALNKIGGRR